MRKIILFLAAVIAMNTAVFAGHDHGLAKIDTKASTFEWIGEKVAGAHNGTINIQSGTLDLHANKISGGSFVIDMNSIQCLDLKDPKWNEKLVGHLKSDDFFSVAKHQTAKFVITKAVEQKGENGNNYMITGNLTIKGITHEISFPAKISMSGNTIKASADFKVNRTKWNIKYGSGSFFDNLGDKAIADDFQVKINLTATK